MAFNVNEIVTAINKTGIAKTSHFEVQITGAGLGDEESLMSRADSVDIPGRSLMTAEHKFYNYGPLTKLPYGGQTYTDVTVSFILSEDMREKEYFEIWQNNIVNTGAFETGSSQSDFYGYTQSKFNPKYFEDYIGTLVIRQYGENGELRSIYTLNEAYPIIINPISMSWSQTEIAKLSVTFAYRNYKCLFAKQPQSSRGRGFSLSIGPNGISGSARLPGIGDVSGTLNQGGLKTVNASVGDITNKVAQIRRSF